MSAITHDLEKINHYKKQYGLDNHNSPKAVARALNLHYNTLTKARIDGLLMGREAPKHIKFGHTVIYRIEDLIDWLEMLDADCQEGM